MLKHQQLSKTVINADEKLDIIDHLNDDHKDEIQLIAQYFGVATTEPVEVSNIYIEGFDVTICQGTNKQSVFIPFLCNGKTEEQFLFLAYKAMVKKGKMMKGTKNHYFQVIKTQKLSTNMMRLILSSESALPKKPAGYAYLFALKIFKGNKHYQDKELTSMPLWMRWWFAGLLLVMKRMKSKSRERIMLSMLQGVRYYTLRSSHPLKIADKEHHIAYIDVYTHGNSPGSVWCDGLIVGDIVRSTSEMEEKTAHLSTGHTLLIADETAMPALAGIFEDWQNPIAPTVIIISANQDEQTYIEQDIIPHNSVLHRIVAPQDQQLKAVMAILADIKQLDNVWGACEGEDAKAIRRYIRDHFQLAGKNNRIKGYWRAKAENN